MIKRTVLLSSALILVVALGLLPFRPLGATAAQAACCSYATDDLVPSVGLDNVGNRFVFWSNLQYGLEEAFYDAATSRWSKAFTVNGGMGPMASEPTVAVGSATTTTIGSGYQFVFWEGQPPDNNLYEAYFDGSWHGPIDLKMGPLGSAPSATIDMSQGIVTVVWRGTDNQIWYAYTKDGNSPSHQSWSGPHKAGWGPVANPPTAADGTSPEVQVFWQGNDDYLWHGTLEEAGPPVFGPRRLNSGLLGSQPSATGYQPPASGGDVYHVFWFGTDGQLWTQEWNPVLGNPAGSAGPVTEIPRMGPLGSAPSCAYQQGTLGNFYCFWAGYTSPYNLWEASGSPKGVVGPTDLGYGPLKFS